MQPRPAPLLTSRAADEAADDAAAARARAHQLLLPSTLFSYSPHLLARQLAVQDETRQAILGLSSRLVRLHLSGKSCRHALSGTLRDASCRRVRTLARVLKSLPLLSIPRIFVLPAITILAVLSLTITIRSASAAERCATEATYLLAQHPPGRVPARDWRARRQDPYLVDAPDFVPFTRGQSSKCPAAVHDDAT